ncbi:MAG: dihydroorotate dehydrogenase electron transfer subunit [Thermoplasmatota archaeon]
MSPSGRAGKGPGAAPGPRVIRIVARKRETHLVTTLRWRDPSPALPGQFVMVWVPGVDEIPMSLSHIGPLKGIAVHVKGEASRALASMSVGDRIGVRGPLGRGFDPLPGKSLVVAGGTGIAALSPLIEALSARRWRPTVVLGANSSRELLFADRARRVGARLVVATEDGSEGFRGLATDAARELLRGPGFDRIYTCGPELMMKAVAEMGAERRIPVQLSLERFMKCGLGICDSCAMGGLHVCVDGPVVDGRTALSLPEFGRYRRDACGRRERL